MIKPVSYSKFTYKSDIPKPSLATTPTGVLHATRISPLRSEHCFAYLADITYAENAIGHLHKYGFARSNIVFIPYSSKKNWCRRYPHAVPHVECDEAGNVKGYPFLYHDVDNLGEVSMEERRAEGAASGERASRKKINRKLPKLFKEGELFDSEREELHKEIYSYFIWLEKQMHEMEDTEEGSLASTSGINVKGFKKLMAGMKSTFKVCKFSTLNEEKSELPLLEIHLGEELHHRARASKTRKRKLLESSSKLHATSDDAKKRKVAKTPQSIATQEQATPTNNVTEDATMTNITAETESSTTKHSNDAQKQETPTNDVTVGASAGAVSTTNTSNAAPTKRLGRPKLTEDDLINSWNRKYEELKAFYEKQGHSDATRTNGGTSKLETWMQVQRLHYRIYKKIEVRLSELYAPFACGALE
jgi:hypothetical protein